MNKLLSKIILYSILPAALIICGKLLGIYLAINYFQIPITLDNEIQSIFTVQILSEDPTDILLINTISNISMISILSAFLIFYYLRFYTYLKVNGNPRTIVKVSKLNLIHWITDKKNSFTRIAVLSTFEILACLLILKDSIQGDSYSWLIYPALVIILISIWSLLRTFDLESSKVYPDNNDNLY